MKPKELVQLGVPRGNPMGEVFKLIQGFLEQGGIADRLPEEISIVLANPKAHVDDPIRGAFATALLQPDLYRPDRPPAPWQRWGSDIDALALRQIELAANLPVSVAGALMPVIPYAVGVDLACRMQLTVLALPVEWLEATRDRLSQAIETEAKFGVGATFKSRRVHDVMDEDWRVSPITEENKDRAWAQLGTSGSGNHFVEFGLLTVEDESSGLAAGSYVALLSHSGSRGTGAAVCDHYSKLATKLHPELPKELSRLAWLSLESTEGREYWSAMELMGKYAAANHALVHRHIAANLGAQVMIDIENHHNFAWKEEHFGKGVVVHRKGATPAGAGVLGIIPGSMASPGFLVRGKGNKDSLDSASHGAGRRMSRKRATETLSWTDANAMLRERQVTLISAGLDEVPDCYKDIHTVMAEQADLVDVLARFDPKVVKMAPSGERPED